MVDLAALLSLYAPAADEAGWRADVHVSGAVADYTGVTAQTVLEINGRSCPVAVSANLAEDVVLMDVQDKWPQQRDHGVAPAGSLVLVHVHPKLEANSQRLYELLRREGLQRDEAFTAAVAATKP